MDNNVAYIDDSEFLPLVNVLKMSHHFMINYNYLITDPKTNQAVIVDPAWEMDKVESALIQTRSKLAGILLTHGHADHIDLAKPLAEKHHCPIWMSRQEIEASGFEADQLVSIEENPWNVGNLLIEPIFTPGHTKGCTCYLISGNLFTGDVLFAEGCGLCPDQDAAFEMFASLNKLKELVQKNTRIYPGHSFGKQPGRLFSQILNENIYLQFNTKESFSRFRMRSGQKRASMFNFK